MDYIPLFELTNSKKTLIVGEGRIAEKRAQELASYSAVFDVVSPLPSDHLRQLVEEKQGILITTPFYQDFCSKNYCRVIACSSIEEVNLEVITWAKKNTIPINIPHDRSTSDFLFGRKVQMGGVSMSFNINTCSPILSDLIEQWTKCWMFGDIASLSELYKRNKFKVNNKITEVGHRRRFWAKIFRDIGPLKSGCNFQVLDQRVESSLKEFLVRRNVGEVYLIGAGPGDPDLLTVKALKLLQSSDIVLYDRLVSEDIIKLINDDVEKIYVGKRRSNHTLPQGGINELLVRHAKEGKNVTRLKGGDPFIFGRGGEEIETLAANKIPFQVVPGITSANGCAAYAGIPLTHRDYSQSVQFVTGQFKNDKIDLNWRELVVPNKTLVFYMALKSLNFICLSLIGNGMPESTPVAVVEKGTTANQKVYFSTLKELPHLMAKEAISSPSLFIVGQVVQLANKLSWKNSK